MTTQRFTIEWFGEDYICDACNTGKMVRDGNLVLASIPPQYPHKCDHCDQRANLRAVYPVIRYERK